MSENYNEQELQQLESEIRLMGKPYASDTPSEEYFTDFRSRLMDRIQSENLVQPSIQRVVPAEGGFMQKMKLAFFGSPLRISIVGVCAVVAIVATVMMNRSGDAPTMTSLPAPQVVVPQTTMPQATEKPQIVESKEQTPVVEKQTQAPTHKAVIRDANKEMAQKVAPIQLEEPASEADQAGDFSQYDETLSTGNEEDPVTYDKLSVNELQAVLKILEEKK